MIQAHTHAHTQSRARTHTRTHTYLALACPVATSHSTTSGWGAVCPVAAYVPRICSMQWSVLSPQPFCVLASELGMWHALQMWPTGFSGVHVPLAQHWLTVSVQMRVCAGTLLLGTARAPWVACMAAGTCTRAAGAARAWRGAEAGQHASPCN